jgi:hypothetical protein
MAPQNCATISTARANGMTSTARYQVHLNHSADESAPAPVVQNASTPTTADVLFRATVTLRQPTDRARLDQLGVVVLSETVDQAIVLVDADQLETLARLRFEPTASDEVGALVTANASSQPGLAESLQPLLAQAKATQ